MQSLQIGFWVVALLVLLALVFDFMNGFHDAANSIATVVSTGVLRPQTAVLFAAFFNVVAIFVFQLKVAATVGKGIVEPDVVDQYVVFGALIGAISWNLVTWWYGIPSSSSHALIGGIVGATIAKAGAGKLVLAGVFKTVAFIVVSPVLGFLLAGLLMVAVSWICRRSSPLLWTTGSEGCSLSLPVCIRWATAATTRRRPSASSGCCSSPPARPRPPTPCRPAG